MTPLTDPANWAGLVGLVALQLVLNLDSLLFLSLATRNLSPSKQSRARTAGLAMALPARLGLVAAFASLLSLATERFPLGPISLSIQDITLIAAGLFLLVKGVVDLRASGSDFCPQHRPGGPSGSASGRLRSRSRCSKRS